MELGNGTKMAIFPTEGGSFLSTGLGIGLDTPNKRALHIFW